MIAGGWGQDIIFLETEALTVSVRKERHGVIFGHQRAVICNERRHE